MLELLLTTALLTTTPSPTPLIPLLHSVSSGCDHLAITLHNPNPAVVQAGYSVNGDHLTSYQLTPGEDWPITVQGIDGMRVVVYGDDVPVAVYRWTPPPGCTVAAPPAPPTGWAATVSRRDAVAVAAATVPLIAATVLAMVSVGTAPRGRRHRDT